MTTIEGRLRARLGPITVHVPDWNGTGDDPLVEALRTCSEGDVLGIRGRRRALKIGTGSTSHGTDAYWLGGPITGVSIVTEDDAPEHASIEGVIVGDSLGGIDGLTLCGVDLTTTPYSPGKSSKFCLLVENTALTGSLRLWDLSLSPAAGHETDWAGYGMMTGVRAEGLIDGFELIAARGWRAQEHEFCYVNNVGWRTGKPSNISYLSRNPRSPAGGSGRTAVQVVNRATPTSGSTAGPTGKGPLIIEHVDAFVENGGGGYAITVAGHCGAVQVRDIRARCIGPHGGVVFYSDVGHGLHTDSRGFTTTRATLKNINVDGGTYSHVAVSGVGKVTVRDPFLIAGTKTAFDFDNSFGGGIDCGAIQFVGDFGQFLPSYMGFQSAVKVKRDGLTLGAAAIEAMHPVEPVSVP